MKKTNNIFDRLSIWIIRKLTLYMFHRGYADVSEEIYHKVYEGYRHKISIEFFDVRRDMSLLGINHEAKEE